MNKNTKLKIQKQTRKLSPVQKNGTSEKKPRESITSLRQENQVKLSQIEKLKKSNIDLKNNLQFERAINKDQLDRLRLFESELKKAEAQITLIKNIFLREHEL
jgi:hypothetical protein